MGILTYVIRTLETKYNMSEQQIADYMGISRQTLYKLRLKYNCKRIKRTYLKPLINLEQRKATNRKAQAAYKARLKAQGLPVTRGRNSRELRKIALNTLGRRLKPGEVIHHIDNNPTNNNRNNLVICTQAYHRSVFHRRDSK